MFDDADFFCVDDKAEAEPETNAETTAQRRQKQKFGPEEDDIIRAAVEVHGPRKWRLVAERLTGRTARQCRERWVNYLSPDITKAPWAANEENLLKDKVAEFGPLWSRIARFFVGRTDVCLKNRYLKLLRKENKAQRKTLKQAMKFAAPEVASVPRLAPQEPLVAASNEGDDDLEGGAFFLEDNETGREDWQFDSFSFVPGDLGELCL
jgi:hypothetical protein